MIRKSVILIVLITDKKVRENIKGILPLYPCDHEHHSIIMAVTGGGQLYSMLSNLNKKSFWL